ncbi:hypothetical protein BST11_16945 [Mycobacterium alsense]|uniref:Scaffolding protein n=1 Tax=Mycobacterium alsense TaxID=324058 RepID=A0AA42C0C7_9MYCO|nr:hypothetical protein [Mycobacterium alsense]MCV7381655.1 hypothetical protein [Mycobacterium alsense]OQZ89516.1 hypothetical protein BST11_16945 [Mycobacterium alsense]
MSDTEAATNAAEPNADFANAFAPQAASGAPPEPSAEAWQALAAATAAAIEGNGGEGASADDADTAGPQDGADGEDGNPNHEAAKWRTKLRDAESQNAALATRLEAMQRAAIDTQVTALGMKPAALWASGAKIEDLVDDTGVPDAAKVQQAAQDAKEALGIVAVKPSKPLGSLRSGASAHTPNGNKWVEAFSPRGSE